MYDESQAEGQDSNPVSSVPRRSIPKPWFGVTPRSTVPEITGYGFAGHERMRIGQLSIVGLILIPIWFVIYVLTLWILGGPASYSGAVSFRRALFAVVIVTIVIVLHEGIHGLTALVFGRRPYFGIGPGYFYMTIFEPLGRVAFLVVALAPLVCISIGAIAIGVTWPAAAGWALLGSLFNISGAGGDLWMARRIVTYPRDALFIDLADGFAVMKPEWCQRSPVSGE